jgi:hypothetical protein
VGRYAADFFGDTLGSGQSQARSVAVPAGSYRVIAETYDPGHREGHQVGQTNERAAVSVALADGSRVDLGVTPDIPTSSTSARAVFQLNAGVGVVEVRLTHASASGTHSIHGACVMFD